MAEEIKRVIEVDTSSSVQTVRQLQDEVAKLRSQLSQLTEGTAQYAAAQQKSTAAEKQLNDAMSITEDSNATRLATARELAETEAREAEAVTKIVDTLVAYRDAGYDVSESLQGVSDATEQATRTTHQLSESINKLRDSAADLIESLVQDQKEQAEVQAQRKELDKEIRQGVITEEQALEVKGELLAQETLYKTRIAETRQELKAVSMEVLAAEGSYDQMSQTLGRLRDEYRQMSAEERNSTKGAELLTHIQGLDTELKQLDADMGNYQRNVGNYENAINKLIPGFSQASAAAQSFSNGTMTLEGAIQGGVTALKTMTAQAMAFIATPLGAAIAALVVLYKALKSSVDDLNEAIEGNVELQQMQSREEAKVSAWQAAEQVANEERAKTWIKVKGAVNEAWEAYKIFFKYSSTLQWGKLWKIISGVPEMRAAAIQVEDLKKQLHELQVGNPDEGRLGSIEKAEKIKAEIAQLRDVAQDQEHYSDEEREAALRNAIEKNKELYALKREELDLQLQIAQAQHEASPDNAQFQQDWVRLRAQRDTLNAQEANSERMLIRSLNKFTVDDTADAAKKAAEERKRAAQEAADATEKVLRDTLKLQQEMRAETEDNEVQTARENYAQELADFNKTVKEKGITEEAAAGYRKALAEKLEADIEEIHKKYRDKAKKELDKQKEELDKEWDEELKREQERTNMKIAAMDRLMGDADRQAARETAEANRDIDDPEKLEQTLQDIQQRLYERKIALIDEMLKDGDLDFDTITELNKQRADLEIENIERVSAANKKANETEKKLEDEKRGRRDKALKQTSEFLKASSELIGEHTAAGKAMAISAATIDTYQAAAGAIRGAFETYPAPVNAIMAGIGAATAIASGIAQVKQIMSVKPEGQTSAPSASSATPSIPAVVTPPAVVEQVPLTRTLTSATEEERLNQMANPQKVYLVYSEVEAAGRHVDVVQDESTF